MQNAETLHSTIQEYAQSNQKLSQLLKQTQQKLHDSEKKFQICSKKKNKLKEAFKTSDKEKGEVWGKWVKLNAKFKTEVARKDR